MPGQFQITSGFRGYRTKSDETNMGANGYLVSGSKNVVSTDGDTVAVRKGYSLFGAAATGTNAVESSYEWFTHRGTDLMLRSLSDELQVYDDETSLWIVLKDGFSAVDFEFAEYWDATEGQDALLFVNGSSNVYYWSGAKTTFASATVNTITKEGATTWAEDGFLQAGTRSVVINGTTYAYTGGETTATLTGVTPDPTAAGHAVGLTVLQAVRTTANSAITDLPSTLENDLIATQENQVWIGSNSSRNVYKSVAGNYLSFAYSSPRLVGTGLILTLDSTPTAFAPQDDSMWISAGRDFWYQTVVALSSDLQDESVTVTRLKTSPGQAAVSQGAVGFLKNQTAFVSNDGTVDTLGRVENVDTPQARSISDPIKPDMESYDLSRAHLKYYKNFLYVALPVESVLLAYNVEKGFWEAPWSMPAGRLAVSAGNLYLHSNSSDETYLMLDGYNDNGNPAECVARFNYENEGERARMKSCSEWYTEGYASSNAEVELNLFVEWSGSENTITKTFTGDTEQDTVYATTETWALGSHPLGASKLAGSGTDEFRNKFRVIHEVPPEKWYEIQPQYSSNAADAYWEILAYGPQASVANDDNSPIKQ